MDAGLTTALSPTGTDWPKLWVGGPDGSQRFGGGWGVLMETELLVTLLVLAVLVIAAIALVASQRARRKQLQNRFGPEYDRAVEEHGGHRDAERKLRDVAERRDKLEIRQLDPGERRRYMSEWTAVQAAFVDAPGAAVRDADVLVATVMRDRGYPVDDFDTKADMVAVDHPDIASNYRAAHDLAGRSGSTGEENTEELRQAFVHYRALFDELLADQKQVDLTARQQRQAHPE